MIKAKLKEILKWEYHQERYFDIFLDGKRITHEKKREHREFNQTQEFEIDKVIGHGSDKGSGLDVYLKEIKEGE